MSVEENVEENKATVRRLFAGMDSGQSMAGLEQVVAANYHGHFPGAPQMDSTGMQAFGNSFFAAFPGLHHDIEEVIGEGDLVSVRMTIRGTHSRPFAMPNGELPATGKSFEMPAMNMFHFENGKVAEQWATFDMFGFLEQLGASPR